MNKSNPNQLNLFDVDTLDYDKILTQKASDLLNMLNEDLKEKDHYKPQFTTQEKDLVILIVANKSKDILCNVLNSKGNTPNNFSVNWRHISHIKQEIAEYNN